MMAVILEIAIGLPIAYTAVCGGVEATLAIQRRRSFEPPPCYVCGHPGPMGELVPKLPCCVVCREGVTRELDAILDPFKEARDREERRLAEARSVTDFATKFGMLPPGGLEAQELAMRLGAPIEVLQLQYPRDSATAVLAQYLRAKQDGAAQEVLDAIARLAARP